MLDINHQDAIALTDIEVYRSEIASLDGIQYFTALIRLNCSYSQLTALDMHSNKRITKSRIGDNPHLAEILVHESKVCDAGIIQGGGIKVIFNDNKDDLDMHINAGTETNDYVEAVS